MILTSRASLGSVSQLLTVIAIFLLVIVLAGFTTRFIAKYQRAGAQAGANIEIIEAFRLSQSQVIELLRIGDKYIAVALSKDSVEKLGEWERDGIELKLPERSEGKPFDFKSVLGRLSAGQEKQERQEDGIEK